MNEPIMVTYHREFLVRCIQVWRVELEVDDLGPKALEALRDGEFDSALDQHIVDLGGDPDSEDFEAVDDCDLRIEVAYVSDPTKLRTSSREYAPIKKENDQ